jgi:hypothetical protein
MQAGIFSAVDMSRKMLAPATGFKPAVLGGAPLWIQRKRSTETSAVKRTCASRGGKKQE